MELLSIAFKNIKKHLWVSQFILVIAFFASFLTVFFESMVESLAKKQNQMFAYSFSGHFMITDRTIDLKNSFTYYTFDPKTFIKENEVAAIMDFLAKTDNVKGFEPRIIINGIYYDNKDDERFFYGFAVDMENYNKNFNNIFIKDGVNIDSGESDACAITWYAFTEKKSLDYNKEYVFLLPNINTEFVDYFIKTKATIDYKDMPREGLGLGDVFMDINGFRKILGTKQKTASDIIGFYKNTNNETETFNRINKFLEENYPHLKITSWKNYAPIIYEVVFAFNILFKIIEFIMLAICFFLVIKITVFSIINRINEIGTMRAIGFSRGKIIYIFTLEGFILVFCGFIIGSLLGFFIINFLNKTGIQNEALYLQLLIGKNFHPAIPFHKIPALFVMFFIVAILAPLIPSIYSGQIPITKALEEK